MSLNPIEEQLGLLKSARNWLSAPMNTTVKTRVIPDQVLAAWDADADMLVIELIDEKNLQRIFLFGWSRGCRWVKEYKGQLQVMRREADPELPVLDETVTWARPWQKGIPMEVRHRLTAFVGGRWTMLVWASYCPSARDLLTSHPKLLWLLTMTSDRETWPESQLLASFALKRREILRLCKLQPTDSAVKILGKCELVPWGVESWCWIRQALADAEQIKVLHHARTIQLRQLQFMAEFPAYRTSALARHEPADDNYFTDLEHYLSDTERLGQRLGLPTRTDAILRCKTLLSLRQLHDRWVDQLNRLDDEGPNPHRQMMPSGSSRWPYMGRWLRVIERRLREFQANNVRYGQPPIPGTPTIVPIESYGELLKEGREMANCVSTYHSGVVEGRYFVYRILAPERCTLGIRMESWGFPRLDQLKGRRNGPISAETRQAVEEWFYAGPRSKSTPNAHLEGTPTSHPPLDEPAIVPVDPWALNPEVAPSECDLALLLMNPDHIGDIQTAVQLLRQEPYPGSLKVVILPDAWGYDGVHRHHWVGIARRRLFPWVDTLVNVNPHPLVEELGARWAPELARTRLQETLTWVARAITDTITRPGLIGVDFADVRTVLMQPGHAFAAVGSATGEGRAMLATRQAIDRLMLDCQLNTASGALACIMGADLAISEFDEVRHQIQGAGLAQADLVLSTVVNPDFSQGQLTLAVIVTGLRV